MSDLNYLKCPCQACGEHLEFPASSVGEQVECPHCGAQTQLVANSKNPAAKSSAKILIFTGIGLLFIGLVAVLFYAFKMGNVANRSSNPIPPVAATNAVVAEGFTEVNDFLISPVSLKKAESGGLVSAIGTVRNDTDRQRFGVRITLDLLDAGDEKIGSASDYLAVLEPHQEWRFKALLTEPKAVKATVTRIEEQK